MGLPHVGLPLVGLPPGGAPPPGESESRPWESSRLDALVALRQAARQRSLLGYQYDLARLPRPQPFNLPPEAFGQAVRLPLGFYAAYPEIEQEIARQAAKDRSAEKVLRDFFGKDKGVARFGDGGDLQANEEIVGVGRFSGRPYFRLAEGMPFTGRPERLEITPLKRRPSAIGQPLEATDPLVAVAAQRLGRRR